VARVRLDRGDLRRAIRGASRSELREAGRQTVNRAKVLAPVDTGRLRASIRGELQGFFTLRPKFVIGTNVDYAEMVHDGTRPHIIRPRRARALRFVVNGRVVYAKVVHHPGTRPRPFLDRALREVAGPRGYRVTID
jgi:Bacteriophage HK97-gp10, putative tail-component